MTANKNKKQEIVTVRINLVNYWPEIWRVFQVPTAISLPSLNDVIQVVMGWTNTHLHEFRLGHQRFADPTHDDLGDNDALDSRTVPLSAFMQDPGDEMHYAYDFGDGWEHRLVATSFSQEVLPYAQCLAGERACPLEDVGGVHGFREFLRAITDPEHEEHASQLSWCGGSFNPEEFDIADTNAALKQHKISTRLVKSKRTGLGLF